MLREVDKQKHVIRYKNDWIFRDEAGFESSSSSSDFTLPAISL
jgi:hypothetical protein